VKRRNNRDFQDTQDRKIQEKVVEASNLSAPALVSFGQFLLEFRKLEFRRLYG
jgi:hypothetical protein